MLSRCLLQEWESHSENFSGMSDLSGLKVICFGNQFLVFQCLTLFVRLNYSRLPQSGDQTKLLTVP